MCTRRTPIISLSLVSKLLNFDIYMIKMAVQLDIESQCEEEPQGSNEGSIDSPRRSKWRLIGLTIQVGRAFASTTANKTDKELPSPRTRRWRLIFLIVRMSHAFASTTPNNTDLDLPLLGRDDAGNRDIELTNISTSIPLSTHSESTQASDNYNRDKEQQYVKLAKIVKSKDLNSLDQLGGVKGFAEALGTDLEKGLPIDVNNDHSCRPLIFSPYSDTQLLHIEFLSKLKNSCNKYILFLILLSAILLLVLGIEEQGWETGWNQGVLTILAFLVLVTSSLTWEYWFLWHGSKMENISSIREVLIDVLRGGQQCQISIFKVVLGDIVCLNIGNKVPADGLFVRGESFRVGIESQSTINDQNPFLLYRETVINGNCHMIVVSVGKVMSELTSTPAKKSSLQLQIDRLNYWMQIVALVIANFLIIVNLLRFTIDKENNHPGSVDLKRKPGAMREFIDGIEKITSNSGRLPLFKTSVTMILLGFSEGMPLVVSLAIDYWNKKATSGKAITQDFMACVTAGSVTAICIDILRELTLNHVELDVYIGEELISNNSNIDQHVCNALRDGIGTLLLRSHKFKSLMEPALLTCAPEKLGLEISNLKKDYIIIDEKELVSSEVSGVLMSQNKVNEDILDCHWTGPATSILSMCSHYYDRVGVKKDLNGQVKRDLEALLENLQAKYFISFAFGHKQVNARTLEDTELTFVGLLGLKHAFRRPIKAFTEAGVTIKLVSEYGAEELKSIALKWGLDIPNSDSGHSVILGDQFRSYSHQQRIEMIDKICILGNSIPSDKLTMVKCLKEKGHMVVMVGVNSDDMPSILEADVGITIEDCSAEAVKDISKMVISQGDLSTLLEIVKIGRCTRENIQKFIQIELTMTIAWSLINIFTTSCFGDSPMTGVQFVWICFIESVFGGAALLTISPNDVIMQKSPERGTVIFLTRTMWRSIITQALYQTAVLLTFQSKVSAVLGISRKVAATMIFNSFVFCQVFNWFNARDMKEKNAFLEIKRNCWFWIAICVTFVLQVTYTEIAHIVTNNGRLNIQQWALCFLIGGASCMIDWLLNQRISDLAAGWLPRQHCCITMSSGMSRVPSSESVSALELSLIDDDSGDLLGSN